MAGLVIIGAGECGVRAAFSLRDQGYEGAVTLIGAETALPYERPPLSKERHVAVKAIRAADDYTKAGIDLRLGSRAEAIDVASREVRIADGDALPYDKLLLATGARPRLFPGMEGCLTLRTDEDARRIMQAFAPGQRICLIGGGFIGLELAATARKAGAEVSVVEVSPRILGRAVPEAVAEVVHARHLREGVEILTGSGVTEATTNTVVVSNGTRLAFDMVIAGVGAIPNTDLGEAAGLEVSNGIVVDREFRTSDPNVFAAGDCCNFDWRGARVRLESWRAAQDQGSHVACAMLGRAEPYAKVPWFWSDQYDMTLQVAGIFDPGLPVHTRTSSGETCLVFQCDTEGGLAAAAGIGPGNSIAKDLRILEKLIERGAVVEPDALADHSTNLKQLLKAA